RGRGEGRGAPATRLQGPVVRARLRTGGPVLPLLEAVLRVRARRRPDASRRPGVGVYRVRGGASSGRERGQERPRRRAGGEAKRFWTGRKTFARQGGQGGSA